jgi:hypothetical protein
MLLILPFLYSATLPTACTHYCPQPQSGQTAAPLLLNFSATRPSSLLPLTSATTLPISSSSVLSPPFFPSKPSHFPTYPVPLDIRVCPLPSPLTLCYSRSRLPVPLDLRVCSSIPQPTILPFFSLPFSRCSLSPLPPLYYSLLLFFESALSLRLPSWGPLTDHLISATRPSSLLLFSSAPLPPYPSPSQPLSFLSLLSPSSFPFLTLLLSATRPSSLPSPSSSLSCTTATSFWCSQCHSTFESAYSPYLVP